MAEMSAAKERAIRLFCFLREYAEIRFPHLQDLDRVRWKLWLNELPEHPSISVFRINADDERGSGESDDPAILIRVRRPQLSRPPAPPSSLRDWLDGKYDDPFKEPTVHTERSVLDARGTPRTERFEDDPARVRAWQEWLKKKWRAWAQQEQPAREAMKVYERLYELRGELEREGERYELVLADGILFWRWLQGSIHFPVIVMPVQLEFKRDVPEFIVRETDRNPELYTTILRNAPLTNPNVLSSMRDDVTQGKRFIHPLEGPNTTAFLKGFARSLAADGEFVEKPIEPREISGPHPPRIWRSPFLLLRPRTQGYALGAERALDDLGRRDNPPATLRSIVGAQLAKAATASSASSLSSDDLKLLREVLFTKPWNDEQLQIAVRLNRFDGVLVQGPPGTGKTHTIANLIGHLLAQGKSVLVTAYTSKALRVVREHIPEPLRSLAVSVLDDDLESRRQLEEAVAAITTRLSDDAAHLHQQANRLEEQRQQLLLEIARSRTELVEAIGSEYRSIVIAGREYTPSEAARRVVEGIGRDDWIPGPLEPGTPLPLTVGELAELYRLNRDLPENEERELRCSPPDPKTLFEPSEFDELVNLLRTEPDDHHPDWWQREPRVEAIPELQSVAQTARELGDLLLNAESWELALMESAESSLFEEHLFQ
ncbi:MAG: AAA family ATPase [Blastocatellia bacterium]|nr:AAA family ATPase [Blastocatellia bacterium]MCS7157099.1 AAA family ATPase [Blastocatellia bacterium]MDW8167792.1 AAA domain-containing protein [Acidobacteriota bacterium]MDW8255924.1 AAA domain-containing protein [Acidobacteriota bacterium]